jgi:predicted nucleic acid-binding protein
VSALVIDTSSWITLLARGLPPAIQEAVRAGTVHLPPIVAAELLSGRLGAREREELERSLEALPLCAADRWHWYRVGRLRASLAAHGVTVSTPDAHVAQCALDLDAELLAEDGIFALVARHCDLRLARV